MLTTEQLVDQLLRPSPPKSRPLVIPRSVETDGDVDTDTDTDCSDTEWNLGASTEVDLE